MRFLLPGTKFELQFELRQVPTRYFMLTLDTRASSALLTSQTLQHQTHSTRLFLDVKGVVHSASPFVTTVDDNELDLLQPAIEGTLGILRSISAHAPNVKRVVLTSSFAAAIDFSQGLRPGYVYTENDWNPISFQGAKMGNGNLAYG